MDEETRKRLQLPFGKVCSTQQMLKAAKEARSLLISVGDRCTYDLLSAGIKPHVCVFDFRCMREPIGRHMQSFLEQKREIIRAVKSPAGQITPELEHAILDCLSKEEGTILVEGEDDLASLLIMAHAPAGSLLIYGQPNEGAVCVEIGDKISKEALSLLSRLKKPARTP